MADDGEKGGQIHPQHRAVQVDGVVQRGAEEPLGQQHRGRALADIAHDGQGGGLFAEGAQHVRHAGVAGAKLADVLVIQQPGDDDGKAERPQQIRNDHAEQCVQQDVLCHDASPFTGLRGRRFAPGPERFRFKRCLMLFLPVPAGSAGWACPPGRRSRGSGFPDSADRRSGTALRG